MPTTPRAQLFDEAAAKIRFAEALESCAAIMDECARVTTP